MKLKIIFYCFLFISSSLSALFSADLRVKLELIDFENVKDQKTGQIIPTIYQGNNFRVKVSVSGTGDFGGLEVLGIENFKVQGTSQSSSSVISNSTLTKQTTFTYDVYADKEGTFNIGPARIRENGKIINSEPEKIIFNVIKEPAGRVVKSDSGKYELDGSKAEGYELFCKAKVDKSKIVVGEPIIFTLSIYARGHITAVGLDPLSFSGFLSKEIAQVVKREELIDGKTYGVIDKKFLLLPTQEGDFKIPPAIVNFNVQQERKRNRSDFWADDFFDFWGARVETKRAVAQEVMVKVSKMPVYSGVVDGVGTFANFVVDVDKKDAIVNEPILLSMQIEGKGNLDQIVSPKLDLPTFITSYESKTDLQQDLTKDFVGGKKRFEFVIQVGKEGECEIPAQKFTYFDVLSRTYKAFQSQPIKLNIKTPPQGQQSKAMAPLSIGDEKKEVQQAVQGVDFKKDINFIEENFSLKLKTEDKFIPMWLFLILFLLPLFFITKIFDFLGLQYLKNWFKGKYFSKKSASKFKIDLEKIIKNGESFKIYQFFLNYFANKYEIPVLEVTEVWIENKLLRQGWDEEKISDFLGYLNQCASLSFAADAKNKLDMKKLLEKSKYWFFMLESK